MSNSSSTNYSSQSSNYWAQQQSSITPACYVLAQDADAVSAVITVARLTLCPFAVRSGGHSDIPGASNIQGGVTVDLGQLNSVQVSSDHKITQVGPGKLHSSLRPDCLPNHNISDLKFQEQIGAMSTGS